MRISFEKSKKFKRKMVFVNLSPSCAKKRSKCQNSKVLNFFVNCNLGNLVSRILGTNAKLVTYTNMY